MCERLGKKKISPYFSPKKWSPYGIVCILTTSFIVEYMVQPFQLLAFGWALTAWKNHYFFGHILCAIFFVVMSNVPSPKKKKE